MEAEVSFHPKFCRHREWVPVNAIWTELPDESLSMSWSAMRCVRCGLIRYDNILKAKETIILTVKGLDEGISI
jgi:hypothetical protein